MSAPEPTAGENQGTWLEGRRDILPANLPTMLAPPGAPPTAAGAPAPARRRPRPWSLLVGLPLVALLFFGLGTVVSARFLRSAAGGIQTGSNIGGDPLLSAHVEATPNLPPAPVHFLEALAKGDGQAMWQELSAASQQQITQNGGSPQALAQALQQGGHPDVTQITFAGGSTLPDGREAAIFVVTANVNGALRAIPYYFTVNTEGKIDEFH